MGRQRAVAGVADGQVSVGKCLQPPVVDTFFHGVRGAESAFDINDDRDAIAADTGDFRQPHRHVRIVHDG